VIVGGLIASLVISVFLLPTLYVWFASDADLSEVTPDQKEME
jgi:cobalt-zinc-cadmium resistance protein CzcA